MSDKYPPAYEATPDASLEQQIMDTRIPKNEREWWAFRRIEALEAENAALKKQVETLEATGLKGQFDRLDECCPTQEQPCDCDDIMQMECDDRRAAALSPGIVCRWAEVKKWIKHGPSAWDEGQKEQQKGEQKDGY